MDWLTHARRRGLIDRRQWLRVSSVGWLSANLAGRAAGATGVEAAVPTRAIRSCILVFHYGGPSQFETFDPKPQAPAEVRGQYQFIQSAIPGVVVGEHLPQMAKLLDRVAIIRSLHHPMRNHNSAAAEVLTGRTPAGGDQELLADEVRSFPTLGSSVSYGLGAGANLLPYVALPYTIYNVVQLPGQTPGFLGGAYDRFQVGGTTEASEFRLPAIQPPAGRESSDVAARVELLKRLDSLGGNEQVAKMRTYQDRALQLLSSATLRKSFDLEQEDGKTRERYGKHLLGRSLLLARRLVEAGVDFITVFDGRTNGQITNWDSHENLFARHRELIPPMDQGLSALLEDLEARGLLASTLVLSLGEFGRTPKINKSSGRDHWPDCYHALLAGGGIRGGVIHGASDKLGAYPDRDGVTPADLTATVLTRFGINPAREIHDQGGRPIRLSDGQPLRHLFG